MCVYVCVCIHICLLRLLSVNAPGVNSREEKMLFTLKDSGNKTNRCKPAVVMLEITRRFLNTGEVKCFLKGIRGTTSQRF